MNAEVGVLSGLLREYTFCARGQNTRRVGATSSSLSVTQPGPYGISIRLHLTYTEKENAVGESVAIDDKLLSATIRKWQMTNDDRLAEEIDVRRGLRRQPKGRIASCYLKISPKYRLQQLVDVCRATLLTAYVELTWDARAAA